MRPEREYRCGGQWPLFWRFYEDSAGGDVNDSLFDLVISDDLRLKDFLKHHKKLYAGEHVALDEFQVHRVPKVTASSLGEEVMIEVDGESLGRLPATFDVGANAISFLAPWSLSEDSLREYKLHQRCHRYAQRALSL